MMTTVMVRRQLLALGLCGSWLSACGDVQASGARGSSEVAIEKCIVIDAKSAWIMTMNASTSGLTSNREYLAVDTTAADVAEAEDQFAADIAGTPYVPVGNLLMSPVTARPGILGLINQAKTTLDFEKASSQRRR